MTGVVSGVGLSYGTRLLCVARRRSQCRLRLALARLETLV